MGKHLWTITLQPRPTPDGHERFVRALRLVAESALSRARARPNAPYGGGLDDHDHDPKNPPPVGCAPAKEGQR